MYAPSGRLYAVFSNVPEAALAAHEAQGMRLRDSFGVIIRDEAGTSSGTLAISHAPIAVA